MPYVVSVSFYYPHIEMIVVLKYFPNPGNLSQAEIWKQVLSDMLALNPGYTLSESTARKRKSDLEVELLAYDKQKDTSGSAKEKETETIGIMRALKEELERIAEVRYLSFYFYLPDLIIVA